MRTCWYCEGIEPMISRTSLPLRYEILIFKLKYTYEDQFNISSYTLINKFLDTFLIEDFPS